MSRGYPSLRCAGFSLRWLLFVAEHGLQACRLSSCGAGAQLFYGMWDLPRPGIEPMSPALADGFLTTAPPGKSHFLKKNFIYLFMLCWVLVAVCGIFVVACGLLGCRMHAGPCSPIRYQTQAPCIGSVESYPLDHQGSPSSFTFKENNQGQELVEMSSKHRRCSGRQVLQMEKNLQAFIEQNPLICQKTLTSSHFKLLFFSY